jgi:hypothetical protein
MLDSLAHRVARFFKFPRGKNEALRAAGNSETTQRQSEPIGEGKNSVTFELDLKNWNTATEEEMRKAKWILLP